jgi:hypothetical protein
MTRKALWLLPASLVAVVASQWKDIARYVKIQRMSGGAPPAPPAPDSQPERLVPAEPDRGMGGLERALDRAEQVRLDGGGVDRVL